MGGGSRMISLEAGGGGGGRQQSAVGGSLRSDKQQVGDLHFRADK